MKIFITGIAGFLGSAIAQEALNLGWDVTGIDSLLGGDVHNVPPGVVWYQGDCCDPERYEGMLRSCDVVYHCAAAPYEGLSVFSPQVVYQNTLMSTVGVLRAAINAKVSRFVFCSSMSRYGDHVPPFTEDMPVNPVDPYAEAKVAAERAVQRLCGLHGMEWVVAVPHNIYGPGQRYYDPFRNVVGIMINRILLGKPPIVYGDGQQVRCFSYIDDVTGPFLQLATADVAGEIFNIGPDADESVTINELVHEIRVLLESHFIPEYYPGRPAEVFHAACSAQKSRDLLGYAPQFELTKGLIRYIDWIKLQGAREFEYHLPVEIHADNVPRTWSERLM